LLTLLAEVEDALQQIADRSPAAGPIFGIVNEAGDLIDRQFGMMRASHRPDELDREPVRGLRDEKLGEQLVHPAAHQALEHVDRAEVEHEAQGHALGGLNLHLVAERLQRMLIDHRSRPPFKCRFRSPRR
jgi:hypothetical protein